MAKLNKKMQDRVEKAEDNGGFAPLEAGVYHLRLRDVDTTKAGDKGPYWQWEYNVMAPGLTNRRLWNVTSLSEASDFAMKQTFAAFGVPLDTDTDDLIGKIVKARVSVRTIQKGTRKGELGNQVDRLEPADEDFELPEGAESEDKSESIF